MCSWEPRAASQGLDSVQSQLQVSTLGCLAAGGASWQVVTLPGMPSLIRVAGGDRQVPAVLASTSALHLVLSPEPVLSRALQKWQFCHHFPPHINVCGMLPYSGTSPSLA